MALEDSATQLVSDTNILVEYVNEMCNSVQNTITTLGPIMTVYGVVYPILKDDMDVLLYRVVSNIPAVQGDMAQVTTDLTP